MGARRLLPLLLALSALSVLAPGAIAREDPAPHSRIERQAVLAYRGGDLETARALYLELLDDEARSEGGERARLLYALGNVSARQGRWREAVGWYEAARRLRPRDGDTWANLELARGRAGFEPADRGDLASTVERLLGLVTPAESRLVVLAGLLAAALGLGFEALRGGAAGRRAALAGILALLLCSAPWLRHRLARGTDPLLVIAEAPVAVLSEPRPDAARLSELRPDEGVERLDTFLEWTRVRLRDGSAGWVNGEAVFPLER